MYAGAVDEQEQGNCSSNNQSESKLPDGCLENLMQSCCKKFEFFSSFSFPKHYTNRSVHGGAAVTKLLS
jgi:hypothetical protein